MDLSNFPRRTVHLDFHTGPAIPDVARDFDPKEFAQTVKRAHVDSVTLFAKCHHGHLYYSTEHPARHPSLPPNLDLLASQIEALHAEGIRAPIYLSAQVDEYAANNHPEWVALTPDLRQVKWGNSAFKAGWQILDMSSPYQDYFAGQLDEVLKLFHPVDGIFLDMLWDQPSSSKYAIDGMKRMGLNPADEADRNTYARQVAYQYMARFQKMIEDSVGHHRSMGVWFNSRPKTNLQVEKKYVHHIEVEALPTGGWGYAYFPYVARFVRPFGMHALSHTARFHASWGDNGGLKSRAALKYECCQIFSQGMSGGIGDLLHPRGRLQKPVWDLIGSAYSHIEKCEPFVEGATHVREVALIVDPELGDNPGTSGLGATRALQQLRYQFDIIAPTGNPSDYRLVIVPETTKVNDSLRAKLQAHVKAGGALLLVGPAGLGAEAAPLMPEQGITVEGGSPFTHVFLRPTGELRDFIGEFDPVIYERGYRMLPNPGAQTICHVVEPYFERSYDRFSGHEYTPPSTLSKHAAAVQNGKVITLAVPLFDSYGKHANLFFRQLIGDCLRRLLPDPMIRDAGPAHMEVIVRQAPEQTVVDVISFLPSRMADNMDIVNDPFPLVEVPISIRTAKKPTSITLQPHNQPLPFTYSEGYATVKLTLQDGHGLLVLK